VTCTDEHKWVYGGICYEEGTHPLPGTGARARHYASWFYCEKCLEKRYQPLRCPNETTYDPVKFDATPRMADD
jgi:hypothetical protein